MPRKNHFQKYKYWLSLTAIWTLFMLVLAWQQITTSNAGIMKLAENEAVSSFNKDLVYRRWAAGHGGVYVPVSETTSPSPYLAKIPERDITTPSGRRLTLVNPAYMTRQVHELAQDQYKLRSHITSLNPIRPENAADSWEAERLLAIENGRENNPSVETIDGEEFLRMMFPMKTEKICLKCHEDQGYQVGDIRGGISVSVPLSDFEAAQMANLETIIGADLFLWFLGLGGIGWTRRNINRQFGKLDQVRRAAEASEKKFRRLFDSAPIMMTISDPGKGTYFEVNKKFCEMSGYTREEIVGKSTAEIGWIADDERRRLVAVIKKHGYVDGMEVSACRKDGQIRRCSYFGELLQVDGEERLLLLALDITEHRKLEERVLQAEKMQAIGELAGGIAHDFNNQLSGVLGYADLLLMKTADPKIRDYAQSIKRSAKRAADLTQQLLAFSRKGKYLSLPVQIHQLLHEVVSILEHSLDKRIQIRQILNANPSTVIGDATQLQNALLNIAINARDAMPSGGELQFETHILELDEVFCRARGADISAGNFLLLTISDTGTGIKAEELTRIFEPFYTTKGLGKGTGMGLASAYGTLRSHHGFIDVKSEVGVGTTFSLYLPLPAKTSLRLVEERVRLPIPGSGRILLVDDEETVRAVGGEMLEELGYQVSCCEDGASAVEYYRQFWPEVDLILLDMVMPKLDGRDAFVAMRDINPELLVVLLSGYSAGKQIQDLLDNGAKAFVSKPFDRVELSYTIAQVLQQSRESRASDP